MGNIRISVCLLLFSAIIFPQRLNCLEAKYSLEIHTSRCVMQLYILKGDGSQSLVRAYNVATAAPRLPRPLGRGVITNIELDPWWYPTEYTRWYFYTKKRIHLPSRVPPESKLNYMGRFKMSLSHRTCRGNIYRIHGNNDKSKIGKRVTGGCIRMHNYEGLELARKLKIGTEVNIHP